MLINKVLISVAVTLCIVTPAFFYFSPLSISIEDSNQSSTVKDPFMVHDDKPTLVRAVNEMLPLYMEHMLLSEVLTNEQKTSLELGVKPLFNGYMVDGDVSSLGKAFALKDAIINHDFSIQKTENTR